MQGRADSNHVERAAHLPNFRKSGLVERVRGERARTSPMNRPPGLSNPYTPFTTLCGSRFIQCSAAFEKTASNCPSLPRLARSWPSHSIHEILDLSLEEVEEEERFWRALERREEEESRPTILPPGRTAGRSESIVRSPEPHPRSRMRSCATVSVVSEVSVSKHGRDTHAWTRSEEVECWACVLRRVDEAGIGVVALGRPPVVARHGGNRERAGEGGPGER